ncbi:glycosyltransferase family 2 protein, partial [Marine Group I thaumarchaeote]|nr:glycosyltransferase family 2 protein [Marine Group I thaumarchaeote]
MKITVGLPAYNEEKNIAKIIVQLKKVADQIIVCDDGSTDLTSRIAESLGTIVIKHPKNLGYGSAIRSIFLKAREINSEILVTIDSDGQHKIEDVEKVVKPVVDGRADISIGSRFLDKDDNAPKYRKLGINIITKVTNS